MTLEQFKMWKAIKHFWNGCRANELLWHGNVDISQKENNEGVALGGKWYLYECIVCKNPFLSRHKLNSNEMGKLVGVEGSGIMI